MAACPYCTASIAPGLYQCPSCAAPLVPVQPSAAPPAPQPVYGSQPVTAVRTEPVVSTSSWVGYVLLCSCLGIIGPIIVMNTAKEESVRNFAKAMLIVCGIAAAAVALFFFALAFLSVI